MSSDELRITFVSHGCLRLEGRFGVLVCDPWILNEPVFNFTTWKFPAAVLPPEEVVRGVDYLLITHSHEDHFHVPSLNHFSRDVQVLLPEYTRRPGLRGYTVELTLRALGFWNIRKFRPWDRFFLGGNTPLTFIPSAVSREHDWENCGFVVEHPDCTVLNMNDNLNDRDLCYEIRSRFDRFDLAFIQTAGVSMYPGCFRMSPERMREEADRRVHGFADQKRLLNWLQPQRIAPFAGDFCWLDQRYLHNNWANRATPAIFEEMMERDYPDSGIELLQFLPSDRWTLKGGLERNHPGVSWAHYLEEIETVRQRFLPKIERIAQWIGESSLDNLQVRSREFTERVEKWIAKDYIFFEGRFRVAVEGPSGGFSFVLKASIRNGFSIDWEDRAGVDQTLYVDSRYWAAVLEGRLMWGILQWCAQGEQHVPYREDLGRFWFWLEHHLDLGNQNVQALIHPQLHPSILDRIRPEWGVFPLADEWQR